MKRAYIGIVSGVLILVAIFFAISNSSDLNSEKTEPVFHVRFADPSLFSDGVFSDTFFVQSGNYEFKFIPNGDSPKFLTITMSGDSFSFDEDYELEGTPHETGISIYYTWDYLGEKEIKIQNAQEIMIQIDPHGAVNGPVSISLIDLEK